jgi:hypothetical protein
MKPFHAFAIAFLLPITILTIVGIAAATAIPPNTDRAVKFAAAQATGGSASVAEAQEPAAQDPAGQDPVGEGAAEGEAMHHHMEILQAGMKEMRRMLGKDEQKAELLTLVVKLQLAVRACFDLVPEQTTPIEDPTALAEWRIGYVRRMVEVYDSLLQLELAVHKNDGDKAKELYKKLGEQKQSGHDAYQAE